jgi:hypothetical protein
MSKPQSALTRAVINAYVAQHVQTPKCTDWLDVIRQLSPGEKDQLIEATEAEADAWREAAERDLAENTLESFAAYIEAARWLEWAEVKAARQIIAKRSYPCSR